MEIVFNINYHTEWGQSLHVNLYERTSKGEITHRQLAMKYSEGGNWTLSLKLPKKQFSLSYKYCLQVDGGANLPEAGDKRFIQISANDNKLLEINDFWRAHNDIGSTYETSFFTRVIANEAESKPIKLKAKSLFISVLAPMVPEDCVLAVAGDIKELGEWKNTPKPMKYLGKARWIVEINTSKIDFFKYKLCIYNTKTKEIVQWDNRDDKLIYLTGSDCRFINDLPFSYEKNWKGVGLAIPVFSIRTKNGFGVGEFQDIKMLAEWCKKSGINLIQILPINETIASHSWEDSYPYKAISVMALHPIYINIEALGKFPTSQLEKDYHILKEELNDIESVDYVRVLEEKSKYYKIFYDRYKNDVFKTDSYKQFFIENEEWLVPYAVFSCLRDKYKTADFRKWKTHKKFTWASVTKFASPKSKNYDDVAVHYYIQYNLHIQLKEAASFSHNLGVGLKGDIPIGISRDSVDAWMEPDLFNLNGQSGAPPDDFAILGQNWEFPTYNWDAMEKDGYKWWKKRLTKMAEYFDAFRIDHILGFFRIWEIPLEATQALLGHFKPALPLTKSELQEKGLYFDNERFLKPYIHRWYLGNLFGKETDWVIDKFLEPEEMDKFYLKEDFNTQQKIEAYFETSKTIKKDNEIWVQIKYGLLELVREVLFIKDAEQDAYHPRIALHSTYSYQALDGYLKEVIDRIYIDYFYFRHEHFWREKAMKKLPSLVTASNMLVCGEDLGMIPSTVSGVMEELGILSLEIQRMPKNSKLEFGHPSDYPYLSVASPSTHDMSTVRGWWEENPDKSQRFFESILGHRYQQSPFFCEPWIAQEILLQHLYSSSMLVIFPFQDILAINANIRWDNTEAERINIPSNARHKWRYRMHQSLEEMLEAEDFNNHLKRMFRESGR